METERALKSHCHSPESLWKDLLLSFPCWWSLCFGSPAIWLKHEVDCFPALAIFWSILDPLELAIPPRICSFENNFESLVRQENRERILFTMLVVGRNHNRLQSHLRRYYSIVRQSFGQKLLLFICFSGVMPWFLLLLLLYPHCMHHSTRTVFLK